MSSRHQRARVRAEGAFWQAIDAHDSHAKTEDATVVRISCPLHPSESRRKPYITILLVGMRHPRFYCVRQCSERRIMKGLKISPTLFSRQSPPSRPKLSMWRYLLMLQLQLSALEGPDGTWAS
jgi:hypothetical protein